MIVREEIPFTGNIRGDIYNIRSALIKLMTDSISAYSQLALEQKAGNENTEAVRAMVLEQADELKKVWESNKTVADDIAGIKSEIASIQEQIRTIIAVLQAGG